MKKLFFLTLVALAAVSCSVDSRYAIDENFKVNPSITLFEDGFAVPIGRSKPVYLNELLKLDSSTDNLVKDADGNYTIVLKSPDEIKTNLSIPVVDIRADIEGDFKLLNIDLPEDVVGRKVPSFNKTYPGRDTDATLKVENYVPDEILKIRNVEMETPLSIKFLVECKDAGGQSISGAFRVEPGFKIVFSEGYRLSCKSNTNYKITDGHIIEFISKTKISSGEAWPLDVTIEKMNVEDAVYITKSDKKYIYLEDKIQATGDVSVSGEDFDWIPARICITLSPSLETVFVKNAETQIRATTSIVDQYLEITGEFPSFLDNAEILFINPSFCANVSNGTPVPFKVSADVSTLAKADGRLIGSSKFDNAEIAAGRAGQSVQTDIYLPTDDVKKLTKRLPGIIKVENTKAVCEISGEDYVILKAGSTYPISIGYEFRAPLSFSYGTSASFDVDFNGIKIDFGESAFNELGLDLEIASTIPLEFVPEILVIDGKGAVVGDIESELLNNLGDKSFDQLIYAGKTGQETVSRLCIVIRKKDGGKLAKVEGLKFRFIAAGSPVFENEPLNANQYLVFRNIAVATGESGISLNL